MVFAIVEGVGFPTIVIIGVFNYFMFLPYLAIPNLVFSIKLALLAQQNKKPWFFSFLLFPLAGALFYENIGYFQVRQMAWQFFLMLGLISLTPAVVFFILKKKFKRAR